MSLIKTFMAIGIALIFVFFIGYGTHVIYKQPSYSHDTYKQDRDTYNLNLFMILTSIGIIVLFIGALLSFLSNFESIGSGLLGGGVLTILYGIVRGWSAFGEYFRLLIIFLILILLIILAFVVSFAKKHRKTK